MVREEKMPRDIKKRQYMVQVLDNISFTMRYYQYLYWDSMGTRELHSRLARVYNSVIIMLWE